MWYNNDPRHVVGKRATVVVWCPPDVVFTAYVETKNTYWVDVRNHPSNTMASNGIGDNWPEGWLWTWLPDPSKAVVNEDK